MSGLTGCIDDSRSYFANIISKNGRNEVQIFPINNKPAESMVLDSLIVKFELEADENITCCCWTNTSEVIKMDNTKKRGKRRQSSSEADLLVESPDNKNLVVGLSNGDLLLFSPFKNEAINRISYGSRFISLTPSINNDTVWGVLESNGAIIEISLLQNKEVKTFIFNEDDKIQIAKTIRYKGGSSRSQHILIGSNNLYLVDPSKPKKSLLARFTEYHQQSTISIIEQSLVNEEFIIVVRKNDNRIYLYNAANFSIHSTFKATSSQIHNLRLASSEDKKEEYIHVVTEDGIEIFNVDFTSKQTDQVPTGLIKTDFHDSLDNIIFMDMFSKEGYFVGIWYNGIEPKFTVIDWKFNSVGEIQVPIDYTEKIDTIDTNRGDDIAIPKTAEINNLAVNRLFKDLNRLLNSSKDIDCNDVIRLCSSNDDDNNIKETIKLFSNSGDSSKLTTRLFEIISKEVASQPSRDAPLPIWLKWILLVHGGFIAKQPEQFHNLKNLQGGLSNGMKLMPRLLSLQGRLQLLKSQTQLRNNIGNLTIDTDNEDDEEGISLAENKNGSENIAIANGESDDFEESNAEAVADDGEEDGEADNDDDEDA